METLSGGNMNSVVRIGATVRRSAGEWTPSVHRVLAHARSRGLTWIPEPRGMDDEGREVLSFVPGEVPHAMPPWVWSEPVLMDVARALRAWHDATQDFDPTGCQWQLSANSPHEVICHNDFAPYNCAFQGERFAGVFDFDTCSPGPRLWDIAYCAYRFVPLCPPRGALPIDLNNAYSLFSRVERNGRLGLFLDTYAAGDTQYRYSAEQLWSTAIVRLAELAKWTNQHAALTGQQELLAHARMYLAHARWLESQ